MARPPASEPEAGEGRLANVAGVVLRTRDAGEDDTRACRRLLESLFETVCVVASDDPAPGSLARLADALAAVEAERVLVVEAAGGVPSPPLLLALVAFPEAAVVRPDGAASGCAIYRRDAVLAAVRARLADGERDVAALEGHVEVSRLAGPDLAALATGSAADQREKRRAI